VNLEEPILVTGAAGFIGYHLCERLLAEGATVIGVDNMNPYYDVSLKEARLKRLLIHPSFSFRLMDIADSEETMRLFKQEKPSTVVHLAAQAGVRYSITHPFTYVEANVWGFLNILEGCRHHPVKHLVFASSSSVYGANTRLPFSVHDNVDHPVSLYAATKKANELMAHTYAALYGIPTTGLRFFTVYGPWGRPDMALFIFTRAILEGKPIDLYNYGNMKRDFTYIDDIIEGMVRVMAKPPTPNPHWSGERPDPATSFAPYKIYNIGNSNPVELTTFIECLEKALGKVAQKNLLPLQAGDVPATYADVSDLMKEVGFRPATPIEEGVRHFVNWYRDFYGISR